MANEDSSAGEIDKQKYKFSLGKVKVWDYAKSYMKEYQNFSKDDQLSLLLWKHAYSSRSGR